MVDVLVVDRPAGHGKGPVGPFDAGRAGNVDVAERRLVDGVVDDDGERPDDEGRLARLRHPARNEETKPGLGVALFT